jgi:hypothetical protein
VEVEKSNLYDIPPMHPDGLYNAVPGKKERVEER